MLKIKWGQFKGVGEIFAAYWSAYGGLNELAQSAYLQFAIVLTIVLYPRWSGDDWPSDVLTIVPSILGFSLGGYAMLLAFGDRAFLRLLAEPIENRKTSFFVELNASFVHFIILQTISIILALVGITYVGLIKHVAFIIFSGVSYLMFLYALTAAVAATMAVFRVVTLYGDAVSATTPREDEQS